MVSPWCCSRLDESQHWPRQERTTCLAECRQLVKYIQDRPTPNPIKTPAIRELNQRLQQLVAEVGRQVEELHATQNQRIQQLKTELTQKVEQFKAETAQKVQQLSSERSDMQKELNVQLAKLKSQSTQQQQALATLSSTIQAAQASNRVVTRDCFSLAVTQLTIDEAHTLCCALVNQPLAFAIFRRHSLDGAALLRLSEADLQDLFDLRPIGLRHRLVHCLQASRSRAVPSLLKADFAASAADLHDLLTRHGHVSRRHVDLIAEAQFDRLTSRDITAHELGLAGIPPGSRPSLLGILRKLLPPTQRESTSSRDRSPPPHAEMAQVLQQNAELAARLDEQQRAQAVPPNEYLCPITHGVMEDPVMAEDGQTYEREAITEWVRRKGISPITRERIPNRFIPNRALMGVIEAWRSKQ